MTASPPKIFAQHRPCQLTRRLFPPVSVHIHNLLIFPLAPISKTFALQPSPPLNPFAPYPPLSLPHSSPPLLLRPSQTLATRARAPSTGASPRLPPPRPLSSHPPLTISLVGATATNKASWGETQALGAGTPFPSLPISSTLTWTPRTSSHVSSRPPSLRATCLSTTHG